MSVCERSGSRREKYRQTDMEDSESGGEDGMVGGSRWNNRNTGARDQTQLRQKIRDLPGLLKHGLHLRKKSVSIDRKMSLPCVCFG